MTTYTITVLSLQQSAGHSDAHVAEVEVELGSAKHTGLVALLSKKGKLDTHGSSRHEWANAPMLFTLARLDKALGFEGGMKAIRDIVNAVNEYKKRKDTT